MIVIGMFAYMLRMFCYAIMPTPEWAPLINILNSVTFGFFWIGSVAYVNELAPDEIKATSQGLLLAVLNLASLISTTFCGWLYDTTGPANLFLILSAFSLAAATIFSLGTIALRKKPGGLIYFFTRNLPGDWKFITLIRDTNRKRSSINLAILMVYSIPG